MKSLKAWILMTALGDLELNHFEYWMSGELKPTHEKVKSLFFELKEFHRKDPPEKEYILQRLNLRSKKPEIMWRKLLHELAELLTRFFALIEFQKDEFEQQQYFLKSILGRVEPNSWEKYFRKTCAILKKRTLKDKYYFRKYFELILLYKKYLQARTGGDKGDIYLQKALHVFDQWWIREKLALTTVDLAQRNKFKSGKKGFMEGQILTYISSDEDILQNEFFALHLQFLSLDLESSYDSINELLENFKNKMHHLSTGECNDLFVLILNYLIRKNNVENTEVSLHRIINWYSWGVKNKLLFQHGFLPIPHYLNLLFFKLMGSNNEVILNFIEERGNDLDKGVKSDVKDYAKGRFFFDRKNFKEAARKLSQNQFPNSFHEVLGNIVHWQSLYEIEDKNSPKWKIERETYLLPRINFLVKLINHQEGLTDTEKKRFLRTVKRFASLARVRSFHGLTKQLELANEIHSGQRREWFKKKIKERLRIEFPEKAKDHFRDDD